MFDQTLGHYRVLERVGKGGMGVVSLEMLVAGAIDDAHSPFADSFQAPVMAERLVDHSIFRLKKLEGILGSTRGAVNGLSKRSPVGKARLNRWPGRRRLPGQ